MIACSQRSGRCRKATGDISTTGKPTNSGWRIPPISPMSWYGGSQITPRLCGVCPKASLDQRGIMQQIAMRDHHPFGRRCRARGILQERQRLRRDRRLLPGIGLAGIEDIGSDPVQAGEILIGCEDCLERRQNVRGGHHHRRLRITHDRIKAGQRTVKARWIGGISRHCDRAGVQTAEESSDIVKTRRAQQHHAITRSGNLLQLRSDRPSLVIKGCIGAIDPSLLAIEEKCVAYLIRIVCSTETKQMNKRRQASLWRQTTPPPVVTITW